MNIDPQVRRPIWGPAAAGVAVGMVISGLAAFFTGAGHGWGSAVDSSLSLVGAPLAGVAWALRGTKRGGVCACVAVLIAGFTDAILWSDTVEEGVSYVGKVWNAMPGPLVMWGVLFVGWQVMAILTVIPRRKERLA